MARVERAARVRELLALVGLADAVRAWPHELSGGQQQRVALARALAPTPALLLLDEPFSNLDIHTRERLAGELRDLLKVTGSTALLVTHDQAEAFALADGIGVMHQGRILQWGDAAALYREPADRFVAGFIGRGTLLPVAALGLAGEGEVLLRPEHLRHDPDGPLRARLLERTFRGPDSVCMLQLDSGQRFEADLPLGVPAVPGDELGFRLVEAGLPRFPG
jgi:iron(III) transport system ATP-binding protein